MLLSSFIAGEILAADANEATQMKNIIAKKASVDLFVEEEEEENIIILFLHVVCELNDEEIKSNGGNGGCYIYLSNLVLQIFVSVVKNVYKKESQALHSFVGNETFSPTTTFNHACSAFFLSFAFVPVFFSLSFSLSLSLSSRGAWDSFFF